MQRFPAVMVVSQSYTVVYSAIRVTKVKMHALTTVLVVSNSLVYPPKKTVGTISPIVGPRVLIRR